ncbi:hypothetical protein [Staphylococcus aureus]|uniref:hypothetical protein n=1 Tax=Staphylococcus aureus TaxID=1280 RepID=UPI000A457631|nr:hypothetical protein [Staphylococcus aureus]
MDKYGFRYIIKIAMAGIVLTSVTGAATLGGVSSIAHEVHAEENANQEHFEKTLEGKVLNFKDVLSKNTISIKDFSKAVENELKIKALTLVSINLNLR